MEEKSAGLQTFDGQFGKEGRNVREEAHGWRANRLCHY